MEKVVVKASKTYEILIGENLLPDAGGRIRQTAGGDAVLVVTDDTVDGLYGKTFTASLRQAGYRVETFVIPHGEASKNAENFLAILNFLAEKQFTRSDVVAALGGGVVGDLAGFAAACFNRGMKFIQLPTTLLAAVDSSVGGKTAIDLPAGKNLAGAFYQPELVICDIKTLDTLREEIFRDGCAEVIKYAVIADRELFAALKQPIRPQLEKIITRCVGIKRDIVARDEFDTGLRQLLNFGHTVGHAVEACSHFAVSHGSGVAIGMAAESRAAEAMGFCDAVCRDEILSLLRMYGFDLSCPYPAKRLCEKALSDKKRRGDTITLVVPRDIGKAELLPMNVSELPDFFQKGM